MIVRAARPADLEAIVAFNAAMARETEALELEPGTLRAGVAAVLGDPGRGRYLVAEQEGRVVGGLLVTYEWSDWRAAWFWWIQSVYVLPAARRRGVYRALHERLLGEARQAGDVCGVRLYVERGNSAAQATYGHLGMSRSHYDMFEVTLAGGRSAAQG